MNFINVSKLVSKRLQDLAENLLPVSDFFFLSGGELLYLLLLGSLMIFTTVTIMNYLEVRFNVLLENRSS